MADSFRQDWPSENHFPVDEEWLALGTEAALEPALPIVDPHHHLWHRQQRYLLEDLLADLHSGHNIIATVFMESRSMYRAAGPEAERSLGETEFVAGMAAIGASHRYGRTRLCEGMVGNVDLARGEAVSALLEAHLLASGGRLRGIRNCLQRDADPGFPDARPGRPDMLDDAEFLKGYAQLARYNLSFDTWVYFSQLPQLAQLADQFPHTMLVLDHAGGPIGAGRFANRRAEVFAQWRLLLAGIARRDNVVLKFGGFGMPFYGFDYDAGVAPPASQQLADDWQPYFAVCMEHFGAHRIMFEANFPADKTAYGYSTFWNACKRLSAGCSSAERHALLAGTAQQTYRLSGAAG